MWAPSLNKDVPCVLLCFCRSCCSALASSRTRRDDRPQRADADGDARLDHPAEAVFAANEDPQRGISGTFVLTVKNTDVTEDRIYLNSERDYRHQPALNVSLDAAQREALQKQLGMPLEYLVNRRLLVQGTARRTTIAFHRDGKPSGK